MKKIIITAVLFALASLQAAAQITKPAIIKKQVTPAPTPPPAPAPVYKLTMVKATIRTGNDNKEFPSSVDLSLVPINGKGAFINYNLRNEMKSNSSNEYGLSPSVSNGVINDITLTDLQNSGLKFTIRYSANFQFDAWKIEGVTLTLEFRDQQNNLHPTLGQKTITFGNANGFLNGYFERSMECKADGYFNPLSAEVITTK